MVGVEETGRGVVICGRQLAVHHHQTAPVSCLTEQDTGVTVMSL